jgi:cell division protein ZipA
MEYLRWILLAAGLVLIAGVYLWGQRARRRSATPEAERVARLEPAATSRQAAVPPRVDPRLGPAQPEVEPDDTLPAIEVERETRRTPGGRGVRHEPRFEMEEPARPGEAELEPVTVEPAPAHEERKRPREEQPRATEHRAPEHKVIALRIVSAAAAPFPGRTLREAIESQGLAFGRYRIFHRLHEDGRSVFSLASLKEPGTFELATMDDSSFRGVAMFVVLPAPVEGGRAVDELIGAANAIAGRVGGLVQDERGIALGSNRAAQLRAEAAAYRPVATGT